MRSNQLQYRLAIFLGIFVLTAGCGARDADQEDVQRFFSKNKIDGSPDYAVMKNGTVHLLTIHGYADDMSACMELIKPYNEDPSLSVLPGTYSCVPLNH